MTEREQKNTIRILSKRNKMRLEKLKVTNGDHNVNYSATKTELK